jgi:hypothetical protein
MLAATQHLDKGDIKVSGDTMLAGQVPNAERAATWTHGKNVIGSVGLTSSASCLSCCAEGAAPPLYLIWCSQYLMQGVQGQQAGSGTSTKV